MQALTSGIDSIIKQKKEELQDLKQDSYTKSAKNKKVEYSDADDSDAEGKSSARKREEEEKEAKKKRKKRRREKKLAKKKETWAHFGEDDEDKVVSGSGSPVEVSDDDSGDTDTANDDKAALSDAEQEQLDAARRASQQVEEEDPAKALGLVDVPEDDPFDLDEEEDLFNTDAVDAVLAGDVKLAVIPGLTTNSFFSVKIVLICPEGKLIRPCQGIILFYFLLSN